MERRREVQGDLMDNLEFIGQVTALAPACPRVIDNTCAEIGGSSDQWRLI